MQTAFVLGAGLGTRLRPLTENLPKPLIPLGGRPLITYAFDHLMTIGIKHLIVNTHHCPEAYRAAFPGHRYRGLPIQFVHEPVLLETGGGIANIRSLVPPGEGLVVYNGDILTDIALGEALACHQASAATATLVVRSNHPDRRISLDPNTGRILDIRGLLGTGLPRDFGFTGIYFLKAEFLDNLPPISKYSVIPIFIELIRSGHPVQGIQADTGSWADLGDREAYLEASAERFPEPVISPSATIDQSAVITGASYVGAAASVGAGAKISDSILWDNCAVAPGAILRRCIVRTGQIATGTAGDSDF